jgi:hypothetical protein
LISRCKTLQIAEQTDPAFYVKPAPGANQPQPVSLASSYAANLELGLGGGSLFYLNYLPTDLALSNVDGTKYMLCFPELEPSDIENILQILLKEEGDSEERTKEQAAQLFNNLIQFGLCGKRYQMKTCPTRTHLEEWNKTL